MFTIQVNGVHRRTPFLGGPEWQTLHEGKMPDGQAMNTVDTLFRSYEGARALKNGKTFYIREEG